MQFLVPNELKAGFWAIEAQHLAPELIDFGQGWAHSGWTLNPHLHRHWEFYLQIEGETEWAAMGQKAVTLGSGSLYCVAPNINHWMFRSSDSNRYMFVGVDLRLMLNRLPQLAETVLDGFETVDGVGRLEAYFGEVLREATTKQHYQNLGLRLALDTLVLQVIRSFSSSNEILPGSPPHRQWPALYTCYRAVFANLGLWNFWHVKSASLEVDWPHFFSTETGSTIHRTLLKQRIAAAKYLLRNSDLTIREVAQACGFQTGEHFAHIFRAQNGSTPRGFRNHPPYHRLVGNR